MGRARRQFALSALLLAVLAGGCAPGESETAIASVDGEHLTIEEAAQLLAPNTGFANVEESVRSLAELWIEFTLVGDVLSDDAMLAGADVSRVIELQARSPMIRGLRGAVIDADTALTEDEVYDAYVEENPGTRLRARHILVTVPAGTTPASRDTLRAVTERIRARVEGGRSFEEVAGLYSEDPGSASQGGDLGEFGRGDMVPGFEEAAFALEPGELSEIVESEFGFHIIRVDERIDPEFEEVRADVRVREQNRAQAQAESIYIAGLEEETGMSMADGALDRVRAIAENPGVELSDPDAPLYSFEEGGLTEGEFREYLVLQPRELAVQIRSASDEQLQPLIRNLGRQELLVAEAERLEVEPADEDRMVEAAQIQQQAVVAARTMGLARNLEADEGTTVREAAHETLASILRGDVQIMPFGPTVGALQLQHDTRIYPERFGAVSARVEEIRSSPEFEPFEREDPAGTAAPGGP